MSYKMKKHMIWNKAMGMVYVFKRSKLLSVHCIMYIMANFKNMDAVHCIILYDTIVL